MSDKKSKGNILLAVSGGIAAYKSIELCSQLRKNGYNIKVMMTKSAKEFVTPLTFETVTQNPVISEMFSRTTHWDVEHISLAKWADLVVVCPATANIISKLACGICDDFVTTTLLATKAHCIIAPAMNTAMYEHPSIQKNLETLSNYGYNFISPDSGQLACGDTGRGKLASIDKIFDQIEYQFNVQADQPLKGKTILVTAGATREQIDPVRYLSNPSTGKMGYAVAEAATKKGAHVILITAPTNLTPPQFAEVVNVTSTKEMYDQVMENLNKAHIVVKTAAVSDYRPSTKFSSKLKKDDVNDDYQLSLVKNPDILKEVGKNKDGQIVVGFAAETDDILKNAKKKMKNKNTDMLIVNDISAKNAGFETDVNTVKILFLSGEIKELPTMSKTRLGDIIVDEIENCIYSDRPY
ncbi:bifunctional phosphopantothenoylcysteine decarboxylase/phosphopantothenate--cysteine ligase CoaBC [Natranaerobius trueperi]|uniref:Coenzyme A biosynthesis bifunctional protein CoaBC n=1 Tax=Natranaerobius trueperi TaxID=759412 RepID=A0A226BZ07_9FIRM|nr:bifunctional phosphopantothenoylcysteine decarboxylase/phosphopantothenate--cysteine ligase CoaBC [Natranaerobius trueperi]OWZ84161.1 bifunctional 4'-phosphopantothenoylcysteine decarboxylase/phosphopantothenoylcysteine synthetase [Natranaerobius trueperi]